MPTDLELAIFRTVAYFSYFRYPVTTFEIWKWLLEPGQLYDYYDVLSTLTTSSWLRERFEYSRGFYGLGEIVEQIANRQERLVNALRKYAKLAWVMEIVGRAPHIEGVAICNSLAFHHTLPTSDIDLFIVTNSDRVWTARLLATAPLMLLRQRPGERTEDPVCLSFFVTPGALGFEHLKISERDPYLAYWSQTLIPLFDRSSWLEKFQTENTWMQKVLPHAYPVKRARAFRYKERKAIPGVGISEAFAKKIQEERFPKAIHELKNRDTRVIVNEVMLKFHEHDRRAEIKEAMERHVESVL